MEGETGWMEVLRVAKEALEGRALERGNEQEGRALRQQSEAGSGSSGSTNSSLARLPQDVVDLICFYVVFERDDAPGNGEEAHRGSEMLLSRSQGVSPLHVSSPRLQALIDEALVTVADDVRAGAAALEEDQSPAQPMTCPPCMSFLQHCCVLRYAMRLGDRRLLNTLLQFPISETIFVLAFLVRHALLAPQFLRWLLEPEYSTGCDILFALVLNKALSLPSLLHLVCDTLRLTQAVKEEQATRVLKQIQTLFPESGTMTQHILLQNRLLAPLLLSLLTDSLQPGSDILIKLHHVRPHFTGFASWLRSNADTAPVVALKGRLRTLMTQDNVLASVENQLLLLRSLAIVYNSTCLPLPREDMMPLLSFVERILSAAADTLKEKRQQRQDASSSSTRSDLVECSMAVLMLCGAVCHLDTGASLEAFMRCVDLATPAPKHTTSTAPGDGDDGGSPNAQHHQPQLLGANVLLLLMFLFDNNLDRVTQLARTMVDLDTAAKVPADVLLRARDAITDRLVHKSDRLARLSLMLPVNSHISTGATAAAPVDAVLSFVMKRVYVRFALDPTPWVLGQVAALAPTEPVSPALARLVKACAALCIEPLGCTYAGFQQRPAQHEKFANCPGFSPASHALLAQIPQKELAPWALKALYVLVYEFCRHRRLAAEGLEYPFKGSPPCPSGYPAAVLHSLNLSALLHLVRNAPTAAAPLYGTLVRLSCWVQPELAVSRTAIACTTTSSSFSSSASATAAAAVDLEAEAARTSPAPAASGRERGSGESGMGTAAATMDTAEDGTGEHTTATTAATSLHTRASATEPLPHRDVPVGSSIETLQALAAVPVDEVTQQHIDTFKRAVDDASCAATHAHAAAVRDAFVVLDAALPAELWVHVLTAWMPHRKEPAQHAHTHGHAEVRGTQSRIWESGSRAEALRGTRATKVEQQQQQQQQQKEHEREQRRRQRLRLNVRHLLEDVFLVLQVDSSVLASKPCLEVLLCILDSCLTAAWSQVQVREKQAVIEALVQSNRRRRERVAQWQRQQQQQQQQHQHQHVNVGVLERRAREYEGKLKTSAKRQLKRMRDELLLAQEAGVIHALLDAVQAVAGMDETLVCEQIHRRILAHPDVLRLLCAQRMSDVALVLLAERVPSMHVAVAHLRPRIASADPAVHCNAVRMCAALCGGVSTPEFAECCRAGVEAMPVAVGRVAAGVGDTAGKTRHLLVDTLPCIAQFAAAFPVLIPLCLRTFDSIGGAVAVLDEQTHCRHSLGRVVDAELRRFVDVTVPQHQLPA